MQSFDYRAIDASGQEVAGVRQAGSADEVKDHLYKSGLVPLSIKTARSDAGRKAEARTWTLGREKGLNTLQFTQELSRLLSAHINVERSLAILAKEKSYPVAGILLETVRKGTALHEAMAVHPGQFDTLYVSMIRAGESSGALPEAVAELTRLLERQKQTRDALRSSTLYPIVLVFASFVAVLFLLGYVVPQFEALLTSSRVETGGWLKFLFSLSYLVQNFWIHGLVLLLAIILGLERLFRNPDAKARRDRLAMKLPVVGAMVAKREGARFARVFGIMLRRHISPVTALDIAQNTIENVAIREELAGLKDIVTRGGGLAEPLQAMPSVPVIISRMAEIGEETGDLGTAFGHAADALDEELETDLKSFLAILEPGVILAVGALVGGIVISILSALMSVTDFIG